MWTWDPGTGLEELGGPRPGQRGSGRPAQKVQRRPDSVLHGGARSRRPDGRQGHRQGHRQGQAEKGACRRGWPEQLQDEQVSTATSQNLQSLRRRLPEAPFRGSPRLHSLQPGSGDRHLPGLFKPVMKNKISDIETVRWQLLASSL